MSREWQPGDVALVEAGCWANRKVALRLDEGWSHVNGVNVDGDGIISPVRPLVVIDPENREQVERLGRAIRDGVFKAGDSYPGMGRFADAMQAALRAFANPKPPKPEEPTGAGATVEDASGDWWIRVARGADGAVWHRSSQPPARANYADIDAVRVLSDGVQP